MNWIYKTLPWMATSFSALLLIAAMLNWYNDYREKSWLSYKDEPFRAVSNGPFKPGQVVLFRVTRCNSDSVNHIYKIAHIWERIDGMTVVQPSADVSATVGCTTSISPFNVLPNEIAPGIPFPPGTWRASGVSLVIGLRKTHEVPWSSDWINVIAK